MKKIIFVIQFIIITLFAFAFRVVAYSSTDLSLYYQNFINTD